jgi:hypothetical protein
MELPVSVHMEKSEIVIPVQGAPAAQLTLIGPRLTPFAAVPRHD